MNSGEQNDGKNSGAAAEQEGKQGGNEPEGGITVPKID